MSQTARTRVAAALLGLLIGFMGWLDAITGPDFGFSLLYLVPVVFGGWRYGRVVGSLLALEGAALWFFIEAASGSHPVLATVWNAFTRLVIYLSMGIGAAVIRKDREQLSALLERAETLARTDGLTGLQNSRSFRENVARDLERARRKRVPITVVCIDIDNFKWVNDHCGHRDGDALLAEIATLLREQLREGDHAARLEGDEFGVLLWAADTGVAGVVASNIVDSVRRLGDRFPGSGLGASAGYASLVSSSDTVEDLLHAADQAMYEVKITGKGAAWASIPPGA
jgi:diguanylate cyclase (GGDEF)-like protein